MVSLAATLAVAALGFSLPPVAPAGLPGEGLTRLTGGSPFPAGCEAHGAQRGAEVEPSIAAGAGVTAVAWQQDRYTRSGAAGIGVAVTRDGGASWQRASIPRLTDCTPLSNRASDPWVSVGGDGSIYVAALVVRTERRGPRSRVAISASHDGGESWSDPSLLDAGGNGFNDKPSVTADPRRPGRAYAVWARQGQAFLARTRDGGLSWEPPRRVQRGPRHGGVLGSTISVLGGGTILHTFVAYGRRVLRLEATRSRDDGTTWSTPAIVTELRHGPPPRGRPRVRVLPSSGTGAAVGRGGRVFEAATSGGRDVVLFGSDDGGFTWPNRTVVAHRARGVFGPTLAVDAGGEPAVAYYGLGRRAQARFFLAAAATGWGSVPLGRSFSLRRSPVSGHAAFLGDYSGLAGLPGGGFTAAFAAGPPLAASGRSDVFVAVR